MRKNSQSIIYKEESKLFYVAVISLLSMFFAYIYFVSSAVVDVVMRKEVDDQITQMSTRISHLETSYIEIQHSVSSDIATHKGYVAVSTKTFIDKSSPGTFVLGNN